MRRGDQRRPGRPAYRGISAGSADRSLATCGGSALGAAGSGPALAKRPKRPGPARSASRPVLRPRPRRPRLAARPEYRSASGRLRRLGLDRAGLARQSGRSDIAAHRRLGDLDALVLYDPDADRGGAGPLEPEQLRRAPRQVDDPIPGERAAIVDANLQRTVVLQVGHLDDAGQLQGLMRRADLGQIENLAVRGRFPVECLAVPRRGAGLVVGVIDAGVIPDAVDLVRRADLVVAARFAIGARSHAVRTNRRRRPATGRS